MVLEDTLVFCLVLLIVPLSLIIFIQHYSLILSRLTLFHMLLVHAGLFWDLYRAYGCIYTHRGLNVL